MWNGGKDIPPALSMDPNDVYDNHFEPSTPMNEQQEKELYAWRQGEDVPPPIIHGPAELGSGGYLQYVINCKQYIVFTIKFISSTSAGPGSVLGFVLRHSLPGMSWMRWGRS